MLARVPCSNLDRSDMFAAHPNPCTCIHLDPLSLGLKIDDGMSTNAQPLPLFIKAIRIRHLPTGAAPEAN